ncbi:unnamed protein product [Paramecium sonneborni]|uniref:Uncharacterized protein n=1 Tax=Paramecium sonneborni TaxID=65129 RepID=A0A8S1LTL8_9CILI|nr:unnamed protein product [Paramecium sonneborni]
MEIQYFFKQSKKEEKEDLFQILALSKDFDKQIYSVIIELLQKQKISDCLEYLSNDENQKENAQYISQTIDLPLIDQQEKLNRAKYNMKIILNIMKQIKDHDFSNNDYFTEICQEFRQGLIQKIKEQQKLIQLLLFLFTLQLQIINQFNVDQIFQVDLTKHSFENIRIKNTSLIGGNFARCNLNCSIFDNIDISGLNLNGAYLLNCQWKNIKVYELNKLESHSQDVRSVCISPDGNTLASGSHDNSIPLWGQQKDILYGHCNSVQSVCFSPDGTTLASSSNDKSIILRDVKTGEQKVILNGHRGSIISVSFSPDDTALAPGSEDNSIRFWDVSTRKEIEPALFETNPFTKNVTCNIIILLISQEATFQVQGALIKNESFENQLGIDLKILFKQKGKQLF